MQDNDIEKELKESADKIPMKSFSERLDTVKTRISAEGERQEVLTEDAVLVSAEGTVTRNNKKRNSLIIILSLIFCCVVILAIVLPITLKKNDMTFFDADDLEHTKVSGEQFFNDINNAGYEIINLSNLEINLYKILNANSSEIKGGVVEINNEDIGYFLNITFYDKTVLVEQGLLGDIKLFATNSTEVRYITELDDELYLTYAYAQYKNLNYKIEYVSLEDNCTDIFEELFV